MQTNLADYIRDTPEGREAEAILRKCVHCGFCTATCPTYQLLGDELDGPRGRIYLIKQVLEGGTATKKTQLHLDRCLTCRSCETTCPSGVHYSRLLDIGRKVVEERVGRGPVDRLMRTALRDVVPNRPVFDALLAVGRIARPLLPERLERDVPTSPPPARAWPAATRARKVLLLESCGQSGLSPATNAAAARVLDRLGITLVRATGTGCCGAVPMHLNAEREALAAMRRNIDAWWPHVEAGAEAVVVTASGCGTMVIDYGYALAQDPAYADKAQRIAALAKDVSQVIAGEADALKALLPAGNPGRRIAFHAPCSLQHGLKLKGKVEALLAALGFELTPVPDAHLCCGSAGTYSILQRDLSQRLLANKIESLSSGRPVEILTANIGCQAHLASHSTVPVRHWIEAVDELLG